MKLIIDRQKWLRGNLDSFLYRSKDNKMCCLGFYALARGCDLSSITDMEGPCDVVKYNEKEIENLKPLLLKFSTNYNNWHATQLMSYNDKENINESDREHEITQEFKLIDTEVEFIN